jgi:hypothetical protein
MGLFITRSVTFELLEVFAELCFCASSLMLQKRISQGSDRIEVEFICFTLLLAIFRRLSKTIRSGFLED